MTGTHATSASLAGDIALALRLAAMAAGEVARQAFAATGGEGLRIEQKRGYHDIVTVADREAELQATRVLRAHFPAARIVGEEGGASGDGALAFYIDPIDGTSNFASGLPFFCASIGAFLDGAPAGGCIHDPVRGECFEARGGRLLLDGIEVVPATRGTRDREVELLSNSPQEGGPPGPAAIAEFSDALASFRAVRRLGSCALHIAYVATGRAAVAHERGFHAWDIAAGLQMVAAAGGRIVAWGEDGARIEAPLRRIEAVRRVAVSGPGFDLEGASLPGLGRPAPRA